MSKLLTHGLSALMEAVNHSERSEKENDEMLEAFEQSIGADDAVVGCLMDDEEDEGEDSVEDDMNGNGVGDDEEMEKLLAKIPPSDEAMEEQIEGLTESCLPILN